MKKLKNKEIAHGDTIIEVMISLAIFSAVSLLAINLMNSSINTAQTTLESTMARSAVDAQSEMLRFIHNSYVAERGVKDTYDQFGKLWEELVKKGVNVNSATELRKDVVNNLDIEDANESCGDALKRDKDLGVAFVLNPRYLVPNYPGVNNLMYQTAGDGTVKYQSILDDKFIVSDNNKLNTASLYPRLLYGSNLISYVDNVDLKTNETADDYYREIIKAEGIWDVMVYEGDAISTSKQPNHYDFYIHACWNAPGSKRFSSITTIVRLHNPEQQ